MDRPSVFWMHAEKQKADYRAVQARIEWFRTLITTGGSEGNVIANESKSSRRITARTTPQEATPKNVLRIIANLQSKTTPCVEDLSVLQKVLKWKKSSSDACAQID